MLTPPVPGGWGQLVDSPVIINPSPSQGPLSPSMVREILPGSVIGLPTPA